MIGRLALAAACAAAVCSAVTAASPAAGAAVPAGPAVFTTAWGAAQPVKGVPSGQVDALSCGAPGDCVAGGAGEKSLQAFIATEKGGVWGAAQPVPGLAALNVGDDASVTAVSCPSAGNCVLGGDYADADGQQAFIDVEKDGTWAGAIPLPGLATLNAGDFAQLTAVSCGAPGNCAVGGDYTDTADGNPGGRDFVAVEQGGSWGDAVQVPGLSALDTGDTAGLSAISCAPDGDCAAGGWYDDADFNRSPFVVSEAGGTWGDAVTVPSATDAGTPKDGNTDAVSCPAAGACVAVGYALEGQSAEAFVVTQTAAGGWQPAAKVPAMAQLTSVSCPAAGRCLAGGNTVYAGATPQGAAAVMADTGGKWGKPAALPGTAHLSNKEVAGTSIASVACASAGNCAAAGYYEYCISAHCVEPDGSVAFVDGEASGTWATAEAVPGLPTPDSGNRNTGSNVDGLSCVAAETCAAGGFYYNGHSQAPFVVAERPIAVTRTSLSLSAATVTYGRERSERLSVVVKAGSGTPSGKVTVKAGSVTVCALALKAGKASCTLTASRLKVGKYRITAAYGGGTRFTASVSAAKTLTVVK